VLGPPLLLVALFTKLLFIILFWNYWAYLDEAFDDILPLVAALKKLEVLLSNDRDICC